MKTLNRISDLEQYGLEYLTGEACALSQRLLFDMNDDGVALVQEYFGLPALVGISQQFAGPWNSAVNGKTAIASIMLPRAPEFYQQLFKFLLFREGCFAVIFDGQWHGVDKAELAEWRHVFGDDGIDIYHNPRIPNHPRVGTRNVHAMSGRAG